MSVGSVISSVVSTPRSGAATNATADGGSGFAQTMLLAGESVPGYAAAGAGSESDGENEQQGESTEQALLELTGSASPAESALASAVLSPVPGASFSVEASVANPIAETAPTSEAAAAASVTAPSTAGSSSESLAGVGKSSVAPSPAVSVAGPQEAEVQVPGFPTATLAGAGPEGPVSTAPPSPPTTPQVAEPGVLGVAGQGSPAPGTFVAGIPAASMPAAAAAAAAATAAPVVTQAAASAVSRGTVTGQAVGTTGHAEQPIGAPAAVAPGAAPEAATPAPVAGTETVPAGGQVTGVAQPTAAQPAAAQPIAAQPASGEPIARATLDALGERPQPPVTVTPKAPTVEAPASTVASRDGAEVPVAGSVATTPLAAENRPTALVATDATARQQPQAVPMRDQVGKPLLALASAGNGEHTVTISVTPDSLGPVTVRAHISDGQVRLELFAPTDPGRDSLRQLLPDLRRDLASTDLGATLDLSSQSGPPSDDSRQDDTPALPRLANEMPASRRQSEEGERVGSRIIDSQRSLDVLA